MSERMMIRGIEHELTRLGQARWMPVILQLDEHYRGRIDYSGRRDCQFIVSSE